MRSACGWKAARAVAAALGLAAALACGRPPEAPPGMVYVPGGITPIGSEDGPPEERPVFVARVEPFYMDVHPVTVSAFGAFVAATGYITDAERAGDAGVLDAGTGQWALVRGAMWRRPFGPEGAEAPPDHPVTQVSWNDAAAYARWAGKRLPTEVEWEHAARGARGRTRPYAWGHALAEGGILRANTWRPSPDDGYTYTSPVGHFGATELGLTDMGGNVWQWTADWFAPYGSDPAAASASGEKAQRGGSFLCHERVCHGYRVSARSHSSPDTALFHVGFRCAR